MPTPPRRPLSVRAQRENAGLRALLRVLPLAFGAALLAVFITVALGLGVIAGTVLMLAAIYGVMIPPVRRATSSVSPPPGASEASVKRERARLTPAERAFYLVYLGLILVLPTIAIGLAVLGSGTARGIGVGLLFVTIIVYAAPVSAILDRRIRRRESGTN